jgi:Tol biopolymer transport system component
MASTTGLEESTARARPVAIADVMWIKNILDMRMSPDGFQVVWVTTEAAFQSSSQLSSGPANVLPRWFPDGNQIAFLSRNQRTNDLCLLSPTQRPSADGSNCPKE